MKDNEKTLDLKEIKRKTNEFILTEINKKYKNNEEKILCELLNAMGYETKVVKNNEGRNDIIATKPNTCLNILLQVKENYFEDDESDEDRALFKIDNKYDVLVTLSSCGETNDDYAKQLKVNKVLGGKEVVELVLKYYSQMSDDFKAKIPLKSMLIPNEWDTDDIKDNNLFS